MAEKHFYEQKKHTTSYLLPYFEKHLPDFQNFRILEIGCAEAGFLDVLYEMGIESAGLEIEAHRVKLAKSKNPNLKIILGDITNREISAQINESFDLIVMRDVIEHIPTRKTAFQNINKLLKKNGYLYITFPPKYSGFAGHQQNGKSMLRYMPWVHLLPAGVLRFMGKILNEKTGLIEEVILNNKVGLTIAAFEKYYSQANFKPVVKELFLFRPIYKIRFNLSPKKFPNIPFIREFLAFGCEYLLQKSD